MNHQLFISARECALRNIVEVDNLGAFTSKKHCRYHYLDGTKCAIGIMMEVGDFDLNEDFLLQWGSESRFLQEGGETVLNLIEGGIITTDNPRALRLIQMVHDSLITGLTDTCTLNEISFPFHKTRESLKSLVLSDPHTGRRRIPKEQYCRIMQALVEDLATEEKDSK